jgi:hypothetical protein
MTGIQPSPQLAQRIDDFFNDNSHTALLRDCERWLFDTIQAGTGIRPSALIFEVWQGSSESCFRLHDVEGSLSTADVLAGLFPVEVREESIRNRSDFEWDEDWDDHLQDFLDETLDEARWDNPVFEALFQLLHPVSDKRGYYRMPDQPRP